MTQDFRARLAPAPRGDTSSLVAVIVGLVCVIIGAVGVNEVLKSLQVLTWPTAKGAPGGGYVQAWESTQRNVVYEPVVRCAFEVNGQPFECTRIHPVALKFSTGSDAAGELSYAKDPTVHYNPANPSDSCLTARPNDRSLVCFVAGLAGLALVVVAFIRQKRRQARATAAAAANS